MFESVVDEAEPVEECAGSWDASQSKSEEEKIPAGTLENSLSLEKCGMSVLKRDSSKGCNGSIGDTTWNVDRVAPKLETEGSFTTAWVLSRFCSGCAKFEPGFFAETMPAAADMLETNDTVEKVGMDTCSSSPTNPCSNSPMCCN